MTPGCRGVIITSGTRCGAYQAELRTRGISRATGSTHLVKHERGSYSLAADCIFLGCPLTDALVEVHKTPAFALGGIGLYVGKANRVHVDVRRGRARWGVVRGKQTMYEEAHDALVALERLKP